MNPQTRDRYRLAPLMRDLKYLTTYGCYPTSAVIELATDGSSAPGDLAFRVLRLSFDGEQGKQTLRDISANQWRMTAKGDVQFDLSFNLDSGYYVLLVSDGYQQSGLPFIVNDKSVPADVAIIRPTFTQWSYHSDGFYPNEKLGVVDRLLGGVGGLGAPGRLTSRLLRRAAQGLNVSGASPGARLFPAHPEINLGTFYLRNNRWDRSIWDKEWGRTEGLWVDEVLSGMPVFSLLEKNNVPYHVYTDIDLHNQNTALNSYRVLIFSGQEGITSSYYKMLESLQSSGTNSFLLWGVQAFGYRQLEYNPQTGVLRYICTRGHEGMWGDSLENRQPDWGDEGQLFGFHFPEPQSATWRYDKLYSHIQVVKCDHPIVRGSQASSAKFSYAVSDVAGQCQPGLTWAGGEVQERVKAEASVIAQLDDERELIGIGEYRNIAFFAPTYLPAFFAYQAHEHPEVEAWFMAALDYLTGQNKRCGSA